MVVFGFIDLCGGLLNMLKRIFRNKEFVFAFAEAAIIFFSFIIVTLYNNYNEYEYHINTGFSFYGLYATFNREIVSENGTVYPAGTVFEVYFISDDGELGLSSNDGNHSRGGYKLSDAQNSDELAQKYNIKIQERKQKFQMDNIKTIGLGLAVFVVFGLIFLAINKGLKNKPIGMWSVLIVLSIICALAVTTIFEYLL